jgi:hypothetical protein
MSQEKRDDTNRKHQEAYKRRKERKEQHLHIETTNGSIVKMMVNDNIHIIIDVSYISCVTIGKWCECIKQGKYGS